MTALPIDNRRAGLDAAAIAILVVCCMLWGAQQVAIKTANTGISPILQGGVRSLGAAVLVWGWSAWRGLPLFANDRTLWPGLFTGLLFSAEFALIYLGLERTSAARGVLFLYTAPFLVAAGAHLFLPGERMRPIQGLGLLAAFAGLAIALAEGLSLPTARELAGDGMMLLAAVFWAATSLAIKGGRLARVPANRVLFYQLAVSGLLLTGLSRAVGEAGLTDPSLPVLASMAYQTVIVAFVTYLIWFWLLASYPAGRLSAFTFLTPLFGLGASWLFLDERVTPLLLVAMALVCAGLVLVNRPAPAG